MRYLYALFFLACFPAFCLLLFAWLVGGGALELADWVLPDE